MDLMPVVFDALKSLDGLSCRPSDGMVYHYTDFRGLVGICDKKELWVSETTFMNDRSEVDEFCNQCISNFEKTIYGSDLNLHPRNFTRLWQIEYFSKAIRTAALNGAFVASFSSKQKLLSQWRAYCPHGGVSIGFPLQELRALATQQHLASCWCEYEQTEYTPFPHITETLSERQKRLNDIWQGVLRHGDMIEISDHDLRMHEDAISQQDMREFYSRTQVHGDREGWLRARISIDRIVSRFIAIAPAFKHNSFSEEQEFRLFTSRPDESRLKTRLGASGAVSYLSFNIKDILDAQRLRIMVGPCAPNHEASMRRSVRSIAGQYTSEAIALCHVPLRT